MFRARLFSLTVCLAMLSGSFVSSLVAVPHVSADPDRLLWSTIRTPSDDDFFVWPGEVSNLVFGSDSVVYTSDIPNATFYKSMDGGLRWGDQIQANLEAAEVTPTLPVWDIAVAPDDEDFVAVVTDDRQEVYVSQDGGETWECASGLASWSGDEQIADIDISPEYDGQRDIVVGTRDTDPTEYGDIHIATSAMWTSWLDQGLDWDVSTVRFSPDYVSDETVVAVASNSIATYLCTGYHNTDDNTTNWTNWTDPPDPDFVEIAELDEDAPTEDEIIFSDLEFLPGYNGDEASQRELFVSYTSTSPNETDDIYFIEHTEVTRLRVDRGSDIEIYTIDYSRGTLMAGEVLADGEDGQALLHFCENPTEVYPDWYEPEEKPPSGGYGTDSGNAIVEFNSNGTVAYCGTSTNYVTSEDEWYETTFTGGLDPWDGNDYDESALSRASVGDNFSIWNQISLIDTLMTYLTDYALWIVGDDEDGPPDNIVYLASVDNGGGMDSIWRTRASVLEDIGERWERVYYLETEEDIIMRRTPEDSSEDAVFFAARDTNRAFKTLDEGQTWDLVRECPEEITDFAIVDSERLYFVDDDGELFIAQWTKIRRWYVWDWTREIDTGLDPGDDRYSIAYYGDNYILVGDGDEGKIALSVDGGETWEVLPDLPPAAGEVHIALDEEFSRNKLVYAATEDGTSSIYRWTVGGSADWEALNPPDAGFTALAQTTDVLYGAFGHGVDRTLIPRALNINVADWDWLTVGLPDTLTVEFRRNTLRTITNDEVILWAIDGNNVYDYEAEAGCLWVYSDTFALPTPWPTSPAMGEVLDCDPCACDSCPFCFHWKSLPKACVYELWVAMDEQFKYVLLEIDGIDVENCEPPGACYFEIPFSFDCGQTYYWRVRATGTSEGEEVHTRWSPPMRFVVAAGTTVHEMHVAPLLVEPEHGAQDVSPITGFSWDGFPPTTRYEFLLAEDNGFESLVTREELAESAYVYPGELEWGRTYYWRVRALEPAPSEWSVGSFIVQQEPVEATVFGPPASLDFAAGMPSTGTPQWVWWTIGLLAALVVLVIVLAVLPRSRR